MLADVVYGADVRMIDRRSGASFAIEPLSECGVRGKRVGQKLERHLAAESRILSAIHDTHTAMPENFEDAVMRENESRQHAVAGYQRGVSRALRVGATSERLRQRTPTRPDCFPAAPDAATERNTAHSRLHLLGIRRRNENEYLGV